MAGNKEERSPESFVWDDDTQLYFHASSGFYHDPKAGWFYSSRDGLYYKYENGKYVILESQMDTQCHVEADGERDQDSGYEFRGEDLRQLNEGSFFFQGDKDEDHEYVKIISEDKSPGQGQWSDNQTTDNHRPPSEWLEETLIDLYLCGYNQPVNEAGDASMTSEADYENNAKLSSNEDDSQELEEGEWIPEDDFNFGGLYEGECDEVSPLAVNHCGYSREEENWQAQYGQVIQPPEEAMPDVSRVDLWDWTTVTESRKKGKELVLRLVGRLLKPSTQLHPSMPSGGTLLKTAPICEARLHLVRVKTGQVYRLRNPSAQYLASLLTYDSSNPTKDWGFPDLSANWSKSGKKTVSKGADKRTGINDAAKIQNQVNASVKRSHAYRDRAAQRRKLHGGYGVGPGQKSMTDDMGESSSSSQLPSSIEEAAAQAVDMSFGPGSYARRILGNMGWKEGDGLGKSAKGMKTPLQAVGNVGSAGLGWPGGRTKIR